MMYPISTSLIINFPIQLSKIQATPLRSTNALVVFYIERAPGLFAQTLLLPS